MDWKNFFSDKISLSVDIYQNKTFLKWFLIIITLVVGIVSLVYTNLLVRQLAQREQRQVDLFAKAQGFIVMSENASEQNFLLFEILKTNDLIPVVLTDENNEPIDSRNINIDDKLTSEQKQAFLRAKVMQMQEDYDPIPIKYDENWVNYIYYTNSSLVRQLRYAPYIQLAVLAVLGLLAYQIFNSSRRSEQNRVWVGLAKETAHQLGTPISSLMAWVEYFRAEPEKYDEQILVEIEKDVRRLEMITARFSNIGSTPTLKSADLMEVVLNIVGYLEKRISKKIKISVLGDQIAQLNAPINIPLFEWVIENICKNAVDAGTQKIDIHLQPSRDQRNIVIDISDNGKGIAKSKIRKIFRPGYTTKKRGWGLGLTLVKRIVESYHNGRIFVKRSEPNTETTFRIIIPKSN